MWRQVKDGQDVSGSGDKGVGVNMKTGPYGRQGIWGDEGTLSALQRQGETETKRDMHLALNSKKKYQLKKGSNNVTIQHIERDIKDQQIRTSQAHNKVALNAACKDREYW